MRFILPMIVLSLFFSPFAMAQKGDWTNDDLDISSEPICFQVRNEAEYSVTGSFTTHRYIREDGIRTHHRSNFRLQEVGSTKVIKVNVEDEITGEIKEEEKVIPADRAEFCSYGPFFEGRKLDFTLRTLVPIFSCKTRIDQGEIVIKGKKKPEGGTETWAECYL